MNKKRNKNSNLLTEKIIWMQILKALRGPAVLMLTLTSIYLAFMFVGSDYLIDYLEGEIVYKEAYSLYGQGKILEDDIELLKHEVTEKEDELDRVLNQIRQLERDQTRPIDPNRPIQTPNNLTNYYKVNELLTYMNSIKPKSITIVSMEDTSLDEAKNNKPNEFTIKYNKDIDNAQIWIKGFATDKQELARFLDRLGKYDDIHSHKVLAVESRELFDSVVDVFDIIINPNIPQIKEEKPNANQENNRYPGDFDFNDPRYGQLNGPQDRF